MVTRTLQIPNSAGVHARAAALVAKTAQRFEASISLEKDGLKVNARSIMEVLMLAAGQGATVTVTAEGVDELEAVDAITVLMTEGFGEGK